MPIIPSEPYIIVRDRRQVLQFSIHNWIIDEWIPLIDHAGYTIYSLYVRMSNSLDERAWPGYTLIENHFGIGRATISERNKLLSWCRLVHIEPGDRNHTNDYYILDIPRVTDQALNHLHHKATQLEPTNKFRSTILRRIDNWHPIQFWWQRGKKKPTVLRPGQPHLPGCLDPSSVAEHPSSVAEHPSSVAEHPSSPAEHPSSPAEHSIRPQNCNNPYKQSLQTIRSNNPQQQQPDDNGNGQRAESAAVVALLAQYNVAEPMLSRMADADLLTAAAWCLYTRTQDLENPPGFIVAQLRAGVHPPADFVTLASIPPEQVTWLEQHARHREWGDWPDNLPCDYQTAELWYSQMKGDHHHGQI
jgi:hypothetical protein